jgi:hypothetical protein
MYAFCRLRRKENDQDDLRVHRDNLATAQVLKWDPEERTNLSCNNTIAATSTNNNNDKLWWFVSTATVPN